MVKFRRRRRHSGIKSADRLLDAGNPWGEVIVDSAWFDSMLSCPRFLVRKRRPGVAHATADVHVLDFRRRGWPREAVHCRPPLLGQGIPTKWLREYVFHDLLLAPPRADPGGSGGKSGVVGKSRALVGWVPSGTPVRWVPTGTPVVMKTTSAIGPVST